MTARLVSLAWSIVLALSIASGKAVDFEYGSRPADSVFDPDGFIDPAMSKEIVDQLAKARKDGVDLVVVVMKGFEGAPPELVAGRFAEAWCASGIHAVVIHSPGSAEGPWIVPGGRLIEQLNPDDVDQRISRAKYNISRATSESAKVRAAVNEAVELLGFWKGGAANSSGSFEKDRFKERLDAETNSMRWRIGIYALAASVASLMVGASLLFLMYRRSREHYFPETNPPRRLGAPHCGGNFAVVDLGEPKDLQ